MSEHIDSFKIKRYPSKQHENQVAVDSERKSIYFHFKVIESSFVKKSKHVVFLNLVLEKREILCDFPQKFTFSLFRAFTRSGENCSHDWLLSKKKVGKSCNRNCSLLSSYLPRLADMRSLLFCFSDTRQVHWGSCLVGEAGDDLEPNLNPFL